MTSITGLTSLVPTLGIPYDTYLKSIAGMDWFMTQELSGSVAYATNSALALGRRLNTQTYAAYVAGAGWSNPSAQLATHAAAGGTATLAHAGILAIGKTFEVVTIISGRTAGSVILTGTGAVAMTADDTYTDNITALGTALTYTPTDDFDGTINCATVTVKQTGILGYEQYPGAEALDESGASGTATAANFNSANNPLLTNPSVGVLQIEYVDTNNPTATQNILTIGERTRFRGVARGDGTYKPQIIVNGVAAFDGTTSVLDQAFDFEVVITSGTSVVYRSNASGAGLVQFEQLSVRPANPMNGRNTALTVGVPSTSSDVGYLYSGNATTAVLDLYSAELNSKIDWSNGGAMMVAQVDTWAAGIDVLFRLAVDADNEIYILRSETSLIWVYEQTTTQSIYTLANADAILGTDEFTIGMSWDVAGVGMQAYLKGAQQGTDQSIAAAIIGNLDSTMAVMFANASTAGNSWAGDGSRLGIGYRTLTAGEHSDYYTRSGL